MTSPKQRQLNPDNNPYGSSSSSGRSSHIVTVVSVVVVVEVAIVVVALQVYPDNDLYGTT